MDVIALARSGNRKEAIEAAVARAAEAPRDVNAQHRAGAVLAIDGRYEEALRYLRAALAIHPDFHFTEMEVAGVHADQGKPEEALKWFYKARSSAPGYMLAHRRAAEVLRTLDRHDEARIVLREALAIEPTDPLVAADLVEVLCFQDKRAEAWPVFDMVLHAGRMRDADHVRRLTLLTELGLYEKVIKDAASQAGKMVGPIAGARDTLTGHAKLARSLDLPAILASAQAREASPRWASTAMLSELLRERIAARVPTSFVRVGDGEARFLAYRDPEPRALVSADEARALGEVPFQNWFGRSVADVARADVIRLHAEAVVAFQDADILGVPLAARLERDHLHLGYLGVIEPLLENIAASEPRMRLTDSMGHIALNRRSAFYRDLIGGLDFVGVVSPHPGLAERLARACGIAGWAEYVVAGETRLPAHAAAGTATPHFPDHFRTLRGALSVPREGAVFLVAAGLLGKIYCDWLRKRGGIAIDVGSVVDAWMGYDTRPGLFGDVAALTLPA